MHAQGEFANMRLPLVVDGAALDIAAIHRPGDRPPILFLHGFGSTKEDYADIVRHPAFDGRPFVAYDAPGCGETACADLSRISIPFLVKTAEAVLDHFGWRTFHLVGHSMGGLTALMLASRWPNRVLSFTDIEGNIAPEDCFLSRQIVGDPRPTPNASSMRSSSRPGTRRPTPAPCMPRACATRCAPAPCGDFRIDGRPVGQRRPDGQVPRPAVSKAVHVRGAERVAVLPAPHPGPRRGAGGDPACGHFPMYSNPVLMWERIARFQAHAGAA